MSITKHASGRWYYQFDSRIAGQRIRANKLLPPGWSRAQAQAYERSETARLYALATGATSAAKPEPLIDDAVLLYLQQHAPQLKNAKDLTAALALLHPWYAGEPLSALAEVATKFRGSTEAKALKPATVRNRLAYLRAACRWAYKHHGLGDHDPAERMLLPTVRNARQLYLSREQMLQVAQAIRPKLPPLAPGERRSAKQLKQLATSRAVRAVFRVAFYSGMRRADALSASVQRQASGQLVWSMATSKNDLPRLVPVHHRVQHLARAGRWPPKVHKDTVSHYIKRAMQDAGLGQYRPHDARHSTASEMINAGVPLHTIGGVLGHKSVVSTQRYAHLATATLADAIKKVGKNSHTTPQAKAA